MYRWLSGLLGAVRIVLQDGMELSCREVVRARLESAVQRPEAYFPAGRTRAARPLDSNLELGPGRYDPTGV